MEIKKRYISVITIILVGFILYSGTIENPYLWDDGLFIQKSNFIKRWSNTRVFFSPENYFKYTQDLTYRPLPYLVHILNYKIWNTNPIGHRFANILLHTSVGVLLYFLILYLSKNNFVAFLSGFLFVIHPVHNEVVNMVSFNETPISVIFFLASFFCYVKSKDIKAGFGRVYIFSIVFYFLGIFSKETAITLPVIIMLYDIILNRQSISASHAGRLYVKKYIPFLCVAVFYLFIRFFVFRHPTEALVEYPGNSFIINIFTIFKAVPVYLNLVLFPFNLSVEHKLVIPHSFFEPQVMFGFGTLVVLSAVLVFVFRKSLHGGQAGKSVLFLLLFILITFLPTSNIIPMQNIIAERYLYLPLAGFCVLMAMLLQRLNRTFATAVICCISLFFVIAVFNRNYYWKDGFTFYSRVLKQVPDGPGAYVNMGMVYSERNEYKKALEMINHALKIDPDYLEGRSALASVYHDMGDYETAFKIYRKMAERKQYEYNKAPFINLGMIYKIKKQYKESIENFNKAIEMNPLSADSYAHIAEIYEWHGKLDEAQRYYEKSVYINPDNHIPLNALGIIYGQKNMPLRALECLKKAVKIKPDSPDIHFNLGYLYYLQYKYGESLREMETTLKLDPGNKRAKYLIDKIYGEHKK
ncbi:MAG: tetratricopeptide repeat protein [Elusimicrobia bacterium]|nr:tetratricopeptide repeat protein [Elusimicrobiota bacterium]